MVQSANGMTRCPSKGPTGRPQGGALLCLTRSLSVALPRRPEPGSAQPAGHVGPHCGDGGLCIKVGGVPRGNGGRLTNRTLFIALAAAFVQLVPASPVRALSSSGPKDLGGISPYTGVPRPSGQWSMFMNGPQRRGRTPIVGAQSSTLAWRISTETNGGGPAVGRNGTIYQGTDFGQLLALNPDGTTKWIVTFPYIIESTPAILLDGRIAFVDDGGFLDVVNANGTFSWRFYTGGAFNDAAPAVGRDGTIYTAGRQILYALHADG